MEVEDGSEENPKGGDEAGSVEIAGREIGMRKARGGLIAMVGYLLSPVSWWNDLFVNIPLAYAFGALVGLVSEDLFLPSSHGDRLLDHQYPGFRSDAQGHKGDRLQKD